MPKNLLNLILASFLTLGLSACSIEDAESENEYIPQEVKKLDYTSTPQGLKYAFEKAQAGFYKLYFKFPQNLSEISLQLADGQSFLINRKTMGGVLVPHSSLFKIIFPSKKTDLEDETYQQYSTPKDLIVDHAIILTENTTYDVQRVYFTPEGSITTMAYDLKILADEIYSDATIVSALVKNKKDRTHIQIAPSDFLNQTADPRLISGGQVKIYAQIAYGELSISLNGVHGAQGRNGKSGVADKTLDGLPATSGQLIGSNHVGKTCKHGRNGTDGKAGHNGEDGRDGVQGGDSAMLAIDILYPDQAFFFISQTPGIGGKKGFGGKGGPGGKRGKSASGICSGAGGSKDGAPGADGKDGLDATDGKINEVTLGLKRKNYSINH